MTILAFSTQLEPTTLLERTTGLRRFEDLRFGLWTDNHAGELLHRRH